jgi:hypothetical protein
MPYRDFLKESMDLVTSSEQAQAAFVSILLDKGNSAILVIEEARALRAAVATCPTPMDLLEHHELWPSLLAAAGLVRREARQLNDDQQATAILTLIEEYLQPRGDQFAQELVDRFLVTKGTDLAPRARLLLSQRAQRRFAQAVLASLCLRQIGPLLKATTAAPWQSWDGEKCGLPLGVRGIAWAGKDGPRTLLFNYRVPLCGRRFSAVLKRFFAGNQERPQRFDHPNDYLALGEIDAAPDNRGGKAAWQRADMDLRNAERLFEVKAAHPRTFFIGAAISLLTAEAVWQALELGTLSNAANANDAAQLGGICQWLIRL